MNRFISFSPPPNAVASKITNYPQYFPNTQIKSMPIQIIKNYETPQKFEQKNNSKQNSEKKNNLKEDSTKKNNFKYEDSKYKDLMKNKSLEEVQLEFLLISSEIERISKAYVQKAKESEYFYDMARSFEKDVHQKGETILELTKELEMYINKEKGNLTKIDEENPQIEKFYREIEELETKLKFMKEDLENENEITIFWKNNCEKLEIKINEYVFENAKLLEMLKENESFSETFQKEKEKERIIVDKKSEIEILLQKNKELNKLISSFEIKYENSSKRIIDLENENVSLLKEIETYKKKIEILKENKDYKQQYEILFLQNEKLSENQSKLENEVNNMTIKFNNIVVSHKQHIEDLSSDWQKKLQGKDSEIMQSKNDIQTIELENLELKESLDKVYKENRNVKQKEKELTIKISELEENEFQMKTQINFFENEKKNLEARLEIEKKNGIIIEKKNDVIHNSVKKKVNEEIDTIKVDLQTKIMLLGSENMRLHVLINEQVTDIEKLETEIIELKKKMENQRYSSYSSPKANFYSTEKKIPENNIFFQSNQSNETKTRISSEQTNLIFKLQEDNTRLKKNTIELLNENDKLHKHVKIFDNKEFYIKNLEDRISNLVEENTKLNRVIKNRYRETMSWKP